METLEVGKFVRTEKGEIFKINNYNEQKDNPLWMTINSKLYMKGTVIKASHNIIDLVEINDIVQIKENIDNYSKSYFVGIDEMTMLRTIEERIENNNLILESILTHEQFENYCFRIEE